MVNGQWSRVKREGCTIFGFKGQGNELGLDLCIRGSKGLHCQGRLDRQLIGDEWRVLTRGGQRGGNPWGNMSTKSREARVYQ